MIRYIKFAELPVSNQERAVNFYTGKLGFRILKDAPHAPGWRWIELGLDGAGTALLLTRGPATREDDAPALALVVQDVAETHDLLARVGVPFEQEPEPAPWDHAQTYALFRDSEGNLVMISAR